MWLSPLGTKKSWENCQHYIAWTIEKCYLLYTKSGTGKRSYQILFTVLTLGVQKKNTYVMEVIHVFIQKWIIFTSLVKPDPNYIWHTTVFWIFCSGILGNSLPHNTVIDIYITDHTSYKTYTNFQLVI